MNVFFKVFYVVIFFSGFKKKSCSMYFRTNAAKMPMPFMIYLKAEKRRKAQKDFSIFFTRRQKIAHYRV